MNIDHASNIADLYERLADRYIADRVNKPWQEEAWLRRLLAGMGEHRRVLDLGCGAGAPIGKWLHGEAMGVYHGEPLYHASLDPGEYESLLAQHGFTVVRHVTEDPTCGGHTVWLAKLTD